jgi:hypothetical protein
VPSPLRTTSRSMVSYWDNERQGRCRTRGSVAQLSTNLLVSISAPPRRYWMSGWGTDNQPFRRSSGNILRVRSARHINHGSHRAQLLRLGTRPDTLARRERHNPGLNLILLAHFPPSSAVNASIGTNGLQFARQARTGQIKGRPPFSVLKTPSQIAQS